jgi:hypothetical protein
VRARADLLKHNPYGDHHGCDFARNFSSPHLATACMHLWVDQWRAGDGEEGKALWAAAWIRSHALACKDCLHGKGLVLQEYGKQPSGDVRAAFFRQVESECADCAAECGLVVGAFVWHLAVPSYPDYDGNTVYV